MKDLLENLEILLEQWRTERHEIQQKLKFLNEHNFKIEAAAIQQELRIINAKYFDLDGVIKEAKKPVAVKPPTQNMLDILKAQ